MKWIAVAIVIAALIAGGTAIFISSQHDDDPRPARIDNNPFGD